MTRGRLTPRLLATAVRIALLTMVAGSGACRSSPIGFQAIRVTSLQSKPPGQNFKLEFSLDFRLYNPTSLPLVLPAHTYGIECEKAVRLQAKGPQAEIKLAPHEARTVPYAFDVDTSLEELKKLAGRSFTYRFEASVNVVQAARAEIGALVPSSIGSSVDAVAGQLQQVLPASLKPGKLTLAHEGRLKLPLLPLVRWSRESLPAVEMLGGGTRVLVDATALLAAVKSTLTSARDALAVPLRQKPPSLPSYTVRQLLDLLHLDTIHVELCPPRTRFGQPPCASQDINVRQRVLDALKQGAGHDVSENDVVLPGLELPAPLDLPVVRDAWNGLTQALAQLPPPALQGKLVVPASFPSGIRIRLPITIDNPNHFPMHAPSFDLQLLKEEGTKPIGRVALAVRRIVPPSSRPSDCYTGDVEGSPGVAGPEMMDCAGAAEMDITAEFYWRELGELTTLLESLPLPASGGNMSPWKPLLDLRAFVREHPAKLVGTVRIDPGYGPIELPVDLHSSSLP